MIILPRAVARVDQTVPGTPDRDVALPKFLRSLLYDVLYLMFFPTARGFLETLKYPAGDRVLIKHLRQLIIKPFVAPKRGAAPHVA
jgi:hypothetical protein